MDPRLEAIGLLYLTFAHATDGALTGEEMRMVAEKVRSWQPEASLDAVGEQIKSTVEQYKRLGDRTKRMAEAERCATVLAKGLNAEERARVMEDLADLAAADGKVTPEETSFMATIAQRLAAGT